MTISAVSSFFSNVNTNSSLKSGSSQATGGGDTSSVGGSSSNSCPKGYNSCVGCGVCKSAAASSTTSNGGALQQAPSSTLESELNAMFVKSNIQGL